MVTTELDARRIAEEYIRPRSRGFRYDHLKTKLSDDYWVVVFAVYTPEGYELDGPSIVYVERTTGIAHIPFEGCTP